MPGLFSSWERRQNRALEIDYAGAHHVEVVSNRALTGRRRQNAAIPYGGSLTRSQGRR